MSRSFDFDREVFNLKNDLTLILIENGGKSSVRQLGKNYFLKFRHYINLEIYAIDTFTQLLCNFNDVMKVYYDSGQMWVRSIVKSNSRRSSKNVSDNHQNNSKCKEPDDQTLEPAFSQFSVNNMEYISLPPMPGISTPLNEYEYSEAVAKKHNLSQLSEKLKEIYLKQKGEVHNDEHAKDHVPTTSKKQHYQCVPSIPSKVNVSNYNELIESVESNTSIEQLIEEEKKSILINKKNLNEEFVKDMPPNISLTTMENFDFYKHLEEVSSDEEEGLDMCEIVDEDLKDDKDVNVPDICDMIARLPFDDPYYYASFPPHNRDVNFQLHIQNIPKDFKRKPVYISHVYSPAHFWFQILDIEPKSPDVMDFSNKLDDEYSKFSINDLRISEDNFKVGMIFAYLFKKHWYRGRVMTVNEKSCRLFSIDNGSTGTINKSNIKYLLKEFLEFPQYCHRGRVHGIKPLESKRSFPTRAIDEFLVKVVNKELISSVVKYDEGENAYELKMLSHDKDLKNWIIKEQIGEAIEAWETNKDISIGPICYLTPTFKALETAHPCFGNLAKLSERQVSFDRLVEIDFYHAVTRTDVENNIELRAMLEDKSLKQIHEYIYG